jgi:hypothetical protein
LATGRLTSGMNLYSTLRNLCYEYVNSWRFEDAEKLYFKHVLDLIGKQKYIEFLEDWYWFVGDLLAVKHSLPIRL